MPKNNRIIYDKDTGAIACVVQTNARLKLKPLQREIRTNQDINPDHYFVDTATETLSERYRFPKGSLLDGNYFDTPLPKGTSVFWQGKDYIVEDGRLTVLVNQPGTHVMVLRHPHYYTERVSIEN